MRASAQYWWAFSSSGPVNGAGTQGRLANLYDSAGYFRGLDKNSGTSPCTTKMSATTQGALRGSLLREADLFNGGIAYYTDVVRSMVPSHGDMRLVCALDNVPASAPWSSNGSANALLHQLMVGPASTSAVPGSPQSRRHFIYPNPVTYPGTTVYVPGGFSPPMFRNDDPTGSALNREKAVVVPTTDYPSYRINGGSTPTKTLDDYVRWRVLNTRQFAP